MEAGRWPKRRCDSHSGGSRGVAGLRWWTGAVMSNPLLSRSSTPEYCQGDCTGKGQPALRGVAPRRSPASLDAVRSQPEVDTQDDDGEAESGGWVSARGSADLLAHCAESAAAHIRPCPEASQLSRLAIKDRNVAEYLAVLHHGTHA
jgi:hypothetical protein